MNQETLFNETKRLASKVDLLSSFVQNDLLTVFLDGQLTVENILDMQIDLRNRQTSIVQELNSIVDYIDEYMEKVRVQIQYYKSETNQ